VTARCLAVGCVVAVASTVWLSSRRRRGSQRRPAIRLGTADGPALHLTEDAIGVADLRAWAALVRGALERAG